MTKTKKKQNRKINDPQNTTYQYTCCSLIYDILYFVAHEYHLSYICLSCQVTYVIHYVK
jgi:hypothetical protein